MYVYIYICIYNISLDIDLIFDKAFSASAPANVAALLRDRAERVVKCEALSILFGSLEQVSHACPPAVLPKLLYRCCRGDGSDWRLDKQAYRRAKQAAADTKNAMVLHVSTGSSPTSETAFLSLTSDPALAQWFQAKGRSDRGDRVWAHTHKILLLVPQVEFQCMGFWRLGYVSMPNVSPLKCNMV